MNITLTERSRHDLWLAAQSLRVHAWLLEEDLQSTEIDADGMLRRLHTMIEITKNTDRKVKARRREAQKKETS